MSKLDDFWGQVMKFVALTDVLQDSPTDNNGEFPVVVALGEELLVTLQQRLNAVGGNATIFVRDEKDGKPVVHVASAIDSDCALRSQNADQLTVPFDGEGTVSMFFDHLSNQSEGVCLIVAGKGPRVENIREVELSAA